MDDALTARLLASRKYGDLCPDAVRRIVEECRGRYKNEKALEKAVRERLHGIACAYTMPKELPAAVDDASLEKALACHTSTKERLPLCRLTALWERIVSLTGAPQSVLDLACGLMPLFTGRLVPRLTGIDLSRRCTEAVSAMGGGVRGVWADLLTEGSVPEDRYDMALMLKLLPLLERQRSGAAADLMRRVNACWLVVSFPTRTLGGRGVGMEGHYRAWMEANLPADRIVADRFTTENELFFLLEER